MWRPPGHLTLPEVASELLFTIEKVIILGCYMANGDDVSAKDFLHDLPKNHVMFKTQRLMVQYGYADNEDDAELAIYLIFACTLIRLIENIPPTIVSLNGGRFEVMDGFFWHMDQLELCYAGWPVLDSPEFAGFKHASEEGGFKAADLLRRFTFLDVEKGCLLIKHGTVRHLHGIYGADDIEQVLELAPQLKECRIFWESMPSDDAFAKALIEISSNGFIEGPLSCLVELPEVSMRSVKSKVSDEREAEREARNLLLQDVEHTLRAGTLREALDMELGQRAWNRVVGRLRLQFPHISKAGAPRKAHG